jgi:hypothetical protein
LDFAEVKGWLLPLETEEEFLDLFPKALGFAEVKGWLETLKGSIFELHSPKTILSRFP